MFIDLFALIDVLGFYGAYADKVSTQLQCFFFDGLCCCVGWEYLLNGGGCSFHCGVLFIEDSIDIVPNFGYIDRSATDAFVPLFPLERRWRLWMGEYG